MLPSRRTLLGALSAASYSRVMGANDRVRIGFIGCGLIGLRHIADFKTLPDAQLTAVCDVHEPRIPNAQADCGSNPTGYKDFRKLLDDKNVDAVIISTPDHWHALQTIMACAAGKDVYVEKPMTLFIKEGRWMTTAARRYNRVVITGTQGRNGTHVPEAISLIKNGVVGKVHSVRFSTYRNIMPGFGRPADSDPPANLDYDMWLGPAPKRQYNPNRSLYHFRWFWDYSGGQMTNLGAHDLDFAHYVLGLKMPKVCTSIGGRYALEDNGETPDTQDALWDYGGILVSGSLREASGGRSRGPAGTAGSLAGVQICGTKGVLTVARGGFELVPDMQIVPESAIPPWSKPPGHPFPKPGQPTPYAEAKRVNGVPPEPLIHHARHWLDCIKNRKRPVSDVEEGHYVSVACHLANLSMKLGRALKWDPDKEDFIGDKEASALLVRPYRRPWDDVLRGLKVT